MFFTGHASKGLEFDHVCIVNYSQLPSRRALEATGIKLEQEHKLMFVMLTRTKRVLSLLVEAGGAPQCLPPVRRIPMSLPLPVSSQVVRPSAAPP